MPTSKGFYRDMFVIRAFDQQATNLQRQGQLALWPPSFGQEAAQVGSARAARAQDHLFPSYREHVVCTIRGVDPVDIIRLMRGLTHGGWDPFDPKNGNTHIYTLVLGAQTLHATGLAMGLAFDGRSGSGDPDRDEAVIVYYGDGASSQGDVHEAMVFAASYRTPQVFFLQNNQWAISVPVATQSRAPLHRRGAGYGIPSIPIDGNDVLASYAVTRVALDEARSGSGPRAIEALTYRMGAHTTSDDPTKYRTSAEEDSWARARPDRADACLSPRAGRVGRVLRRGRGRGGGGGGRRAGAHERTGRRADRSHVRPRVQRAASAHRRAARVAGRVRVLLRGGGIVTDRSAADGPRHRSPSRRCPSVAH